MEEGASMSLFLQGSKELLNEFACIGEIIADAEVLEQILLALPESFDRRTGKYTHVSSFTTNSTISELTVILMQDD